MFPKFLTFLDMMLLFDFMWLLTVLLNENVNWIRIWGKFYLIEWKFCSKSFLDVNINMENFKSRDFCDKFNQLISRSTWHDAHSM